MNDVPALEQLMGAYFHQDWDQEGDEWDVLELFRQGEPELAKALPAEIERTLATKPAEESVKSFVLNDLGGCFAADWDGGTYREWLAQIADRVRAATS